MAIAAKPAAFTLNSGATYYPNHLWMLTDTDYNGGAGTTIVDQIGSLDLTISGADWATDGVHGPYLSFVGANSDKATIQNQSEPIAGITTSFTVAVLMQSAAKTGGSAEGLAFVYDSAAASGKFGVQSGAEGYVGWTAQQSGGTSMAGTGAAFGALDTGEWVWVMMSFNSTGNGNAEGSANGVGDTDTFASSGLVSSSGTMDSFGLGAILDNIPGNYFTGKIAAAALWANTYYTEATQLTIFNTEDPWTSIGVVESSGSPLILPHRSSGGMIDLSGNFRG